MLFIAEYLNWSDSFMYMLPQTRHCSQRHVLGRGQKAAGNQLVTAISDPISDWENTKCISLIRNITRENLLKVYSTGMSRLCLDHLFCRVMKGIESTFPYSRGFDVSTVCELPIGML